MSIHSYSGKSHEVDAHAAGKEAAQKALDGLKEKPQLIIVFSSVVHDQEKMLAGVREVTGETPLMGSSTAGEIMTEGPSKKSVVVMAIATDDVRFQLACIESMHDPLAAGKALSEELKKLSPKGTFAMIMPDGLAGNGADVVRGMQTVLGETFPIVGGTPGDDFMFKKT